MTSVPSGQLREHAPPLPASNGAVGTFGGTGGDTGNGLDGGAGAGAPAANGLAFPPAKLFQPLPLSHPHPAAVAFSPPPPPALLPQQQQQQRQFSQQEQQQEQQQQQPTQDSLGFAAILTHSSSRAREGAPAADQPVRTALEFAQNAEDSLAWSWDGADDENDEENLIFSVARNVQQEADNSQGNAAAVAASGTVSNPDLGMSSSSETAEKRPALARFLEKFGGDDAGDIDSARRSTLCEQAVADHCLLGVLSSPHTKTEVSESGVVTTILASNVGNSFWKDTTPRALRLVPAHKNSTFDTDVKNYGLNAILKRQWLDAMRIATLKDPGTGHARFILNAAGVARAQKLKELLAAGREKAEFREPTKAEEQHIASWCYARISDTPDRTMLSAKIGADFWSIAPEELQARVAKKSHPSFEEYSLTKVLHRNLVEPGLLVLDQSSQALKYCVSARSTEEIQAVESTITAAGASDARDDDSIKLSLAHRKECWNWGDAAPPGVTLDYDPMRDPFNIYQSCRVEPVLPGTQPATPNSRFRVKKVFGSFRYCVDVLNLDDALEELIERSMSGEPWTNERMYNYLNYLWIRLLEQGRVLCVQEGFSIPEREQPILATNEGLRDLGLTRSFCVFNTGLLADDGGDLVAVLCARPATDGNSAFSLLRSHIYSTKDREYLTLSKAICDASPSQLLVRGVVKLNATETLLDPRPASFFRPSSNLIFNWKANVNPNENHICDDNVRRLLHAGVLDRSEVVFQQRAGGSVAVWKRGPVGLATAHRQLNRWIRESIERCRRAYSLAVPQMYYTVRQNTETFFGELQLLLPLFCGRRAPVLALSLRGNSSSSSYKATTVLTLEMAYGNARLLVQPQASWLLTSG